MNPTLSAIFQGTIVFAIVAIAAGYAAQKLMPRAWRLALAGRIAAIARRAGTSDVFARRVEAKLSTGGACGSCDSCRACATPATADAAPSLRGIPIRRA